MLPSATAGTPSSARSTTMPGVKASRRAAVPTLMYSMPGPLHPLNLLSAPDIMQGIGGMGTRRGLRSHTLGEARYDPRCTPRAAHGGVTTLWNGSTIPPRRSSGCVDSLDRRSALTLLDTTRDAP